MSHRQRHESSQNRLALAAFSRAAESFDDPATFHNMALCFRKEATRAMNEGRSQEFDGLQAREEEAEGRALALNPVYEPALLRMVSMRGERAREDRGRVATPAGR